MLERTLSVYVNGFYITYGDDEASSESKGSLTDVRISMKARRAFKASLEENTCVASDDTKEEKYNKPQPPSFFYRVRHCE